MQIRINPSEYEPQTRRGAQSLLYIIITALFIVGLSGCRAKSENPFLAVTDTMEENSSDSDSRKVRNGELPPDDKTAQNTEESIYAEDIEEPPTPSVPGAPGETASWDLVSKAMEIMGDTSTVIVQTGEETINDEHCYIFATGENSLDGGKFTALSHYAVSDSGNLYYMDILSGGTWSYVKADSLEDVFWWGEYEGSAGKLYINNYSGTSFRFIFISNTGEEFDGAAAVYQDGFRKAEYMDLIFLINDEADSITVTQDEEREDSAERSKYTGSYTRTEDE